MRKQKLVTDNIYHIYNRGVEKRRVFMDERDYLRFTNNLAIFNDTRSVLNAKYRAKEIAMADSRKSLVDILAFCLMPNHYHLLLRQKEDGGISQFMNKISVGYTNYFNLKYTRVGSLFQGTFKAVLINKESQFIYIPYYIHLNPLDLIIPDWRENGVNKLKPAIEFLSSYKWSSHRDYIGESNFIGVLNKQILNEFFINPSNYQEEFKDFIKDVDFSDVNDLLLE
ncbi:MAG: transposase [Candidatus Azambacteria bacterium]|nr:transposase [Candidatus Azambacteria bacterium]